MRSKWMLASYIKFFLILGLWFPCAASAQVLSLIATTPFPAQIDAVGTASAVYTVTNETSRTTLFPVNQTQFPNNSCLNLSGSTCNGALAPGASCTISIGLDAGTTAGICSGEVKVWAKPTAYGAKASINVEIVNPVVTPSAGSNGSISPSVPTSVPYGTSITLTATPSTNYIVDTWTDTPATGSVVTQSGGTTYTIASVTMGHTVGVTFIRTYQVTPSIATTGVGTGGSISPSTAQTVTTGENSPTFTATANSGFAIQQWKINGAVYGACAANATCFVPTVTADSTIEADFIQQSVITTSVYTNGVVSSTGGAISPTSPTINYAGSQVFTATPTSGYSVYGWYLDTTPPATPTQLGGSTYTLSNVTAAHTLAVEYNAPPAIAAGQDLTNGAFPAMVAVSADAGVTWNYKQSFTGTIGANSIFNASSCSGTSLAAVCVAAGRNITAGSPLIAVSSDAGASWAVKTPTGTLPASGIYNAASCSGSGATAACIAAGQKLAADIPFLAASTNGGNNWAVATLTGVTPANGTFNAASCAGSAGSTRCIAGGQTLTNGAPFLVVSVDGSLATWTVTTPSGTLPTDGAINAASCSGSGSNTICVAAGQDVGLLDTFLAISTTGGGSATWSVKEVNGSPASGIYKGASCVGSVPSALCVLAGQNLSSTAPMLAVSNDGSGATFTTVTTITGAPSNGVFNSVNCTGTMPNAVCVAVGQILAGGAPFIAYSTDGSGVTWQVASSYTGSLPANGAFYSVNCTGSGTTTAICTAAGQNVGTSATLLAVSSNSGVAWTVKSITGSPAITSGKFYGTGATGGTLKKSK